MLHYHLEIGGGPEFRDGFRDDWYFANLDPYYGHGPLRHPAERVPWHLEEFSVDHVRASHVLEHIPAGQPRVDVFNEVHRVLKIGGVFEIDVPRFPHPASVSDPTHVSFFVPDSFVYFTNPSVSGPTWMVWELLDLRTLEATIHCELRKP